MRIAMLSAHSCPVGTLGTKDTGGMSVYIREVARELGKLGHKVDVFTRVHDPRDPLTESLGRNVRLVHLKAGGDEEIHKLVLYSYLPDFACALENFRKSHDLHYDLIFSHYWLSGQVGQEVREWWGVPHMVMFHTLGAVKNTLGVGEEEPELRIETERQLIQSCHRVIAATEREKDALVAMYNAPSEKVSVVPCGVNLKAFRPLDRKAAKEKVGFCNDKTVLFVGRIEPLKGIDRLLKAMSGLAPTSRARLLVVGGDEESQPEIDRLVDYARSLGLAGSVTFMGAAKHDLMPYFYNAADVCVVSSHYESFGLVALESLACGTPVVATDVGDLKNIIREGETGYVAFGDSPESLTEKIAMVLSWPDRSARKARSIRSTVADFSWASIATKISDECQRMVSEQPIAASR